MSLLVLLLAAAPCPSEADIARVLERTVRAPVRAQHRWSASVTGGQLSVRLETSGGVLVRERTVPAPTTCRERARLSGAVLATWMMEQPTALEAADAVPDAGNSFTTSQRNPDADALVDGAGASTAASDAGTSLSTDADAHGMDGRTSFTRAPDATALSVTGARASTAGSAASDAGTSLTTSRRSPDAAPDGRGPTAGSASASSDASISLTTDQRANAPRLDAGTSLTRAPDPTAVRVTGARGSTDGSAPSDAGTTSQRAPGADALGASDPYARAPDPTALRVTGSRASTAGSAPTDAGTTSRRAPDADALGASDPYARTPDAALRVGSRASTVGSTPPDAGTTSRRAPDADALGASDPASVSSSSAAGTPQSGSDGQPADAMSTRQLASPASPSDAVPWSWDVSAEGRAQSSGSLTGGLGLRASGGTTFGGFVELNAALPRTLPFGQGTVSWNRFGLGGGVRYRPALRQVVLEPGLSVEVAALWVRSQGFVRNQSQLAPDVAACAHLRLGLRFGPVVAFTGARGCWWPIETRAQVVGVEGLLPLPSFEVSAVLGVAFEWVQGSAMSGLSPP